MKLLYFAWIRQMTGIGEEILPLPPGVATVGDLAAFLANRSTQYRQAFADTSRLRAAVNQNHVGLAASVADDDEVAFFPPVTGG